MRIRLTKNWDPLINSYQLTRKDIEQQVLNDLSTYRRDYFEKYQKLPSDKFDVDNFVEEMWDFQVIYETPPGSSEKEEILGLLDPASKTIYANPARTSESLSFTVAHEAGHLSLHASMLVIENGTVEGWRDKALPSQTRRHSSNKDVSGRLEWQANHYAGALLAPTPLILGILSELGHYKSGSVVSPVDLNASYPVFRDRLGISREALRIRLSDMSVPCVVEIEQLEKPLF